jgi:hypothetical protein
MELQVEPHFGSSMQSPCPTPAPLAAAVVAAVVAEVAMKPGLGGHSVVVVAVAALETPIQREEQAHRTGSTGALAARAHSHPLVVGVPPLATTMSGQEPEAVAVVGVLQAVPVAKERKGLVRLAALEAQQ